MEKNMKNLKRLGLSVSLICILATASFAGETSSPPCTDPGQMNTPPCAEALVMSAGSVAPGEVNSPPATSAEAGYSIAEMTMDLLQTALLIF